MSAPATKNVLSKNISTDTQEGQKVQRIEEAVQIWKKLGDISSYPLESKIKRIGGANLHAAAQFDNLKELLKELSSSPAVYESMIEIVFPGIENLARELQHDVNFRILKAGQEGKLELTKRQIAQILANGFFCNFRNDSKLPRSNFDKLFSTYGSNIKKSKPKREKLKCLLAYFKAVITGPNTSSVTFDRVCVDVEILKSSTILQFPMTKITIEGTKNMSECPPNAAQVDFASRYVGGGVLGEYCRQEEIRFAACPELIAALFFAEPLKDNEALIIAGAKPYSTYKGFGDSFEFVGEADPNVPCPDVVIAIDAIDFSRLTKSDLRAQYTQKFIDREILKAYAGFVKCPTKEIATGNWGCGAFLGDPLLKMMLQWIAATMAQKELIFYCFGDVKLANEITLILQEHGSKSAGELYNHLLIKPANRGIAATAMSSFAWFKSLILVDTKVGNIPPASVPEMVATSSTSSAPVSTENSSTAEDEFDFIRHVAKRDDVEFLREYSSFTAKPTAANFIRLIELHAIASFDNSLYNILTDIEMRCFPKATSYKSIASCIFECASEIRNEAVEKKLLAACQSFKKEMTCVLTRRQIACLLANIFLCTFNPADPNQPNISLATFFKLCSKRDENYTNKLFSLVGYFWEISKISNDKPGKLDDENVIFSLYSVAPSNLPIKKRKISIPKKGKFTVCQTRQVIGGGVLEPLDLGDEERIFLAHPEMIAARIFFHAPLEAGEALLFKNVRIYNRNMLSGTYYEDFARTNNLETSAFALIKESSVQILP